MKGRVSVIELMDRPFRELHEYYKIFLQRAEAQKKAEEEQRKKEEEEQRRKNKQSFSGRSPQYMPPTDANNSSSTTMPEPSPMQAELLEEALEELM